MTTEFKLPDEILKTIHACELVTKVHKSLNDAEQQLQQSAGAICIEGCGKCCMHNTPAVMQIEVVNIVSYLGNFKESKPYVGRCLDWLEKNTQGANSRNITDPEKLKVEVNVAAHSQCPFFDTDTHSCGIHPIRPLVCRTYGVTIPADDWCPAPASTERVSFTGNLIRKEDVVGQEIQQNKNNLLKFLNENLPSMREIRFLPTWIAMFLGSKQYHNLIQGRKIADAKIASGVASPDLFWNRVLPPDTADADYQETSVTLAGDFEFKDR